MKFMAVAVALSVLGVAGCAATPGSEYTVHIDPAFSVDDQAAAVRAYDRWAAATPGLKLHVEIGPCSGIHDQEACVHASNTAEIASHTDMRGLLGLTNNLWNIDGGETWIDVSRNHSDADHPWIIEWTFAHELGHTMGLHHATFGPVRVMSASAGEAGSPDVQCEDVAEWYNSRGRVTPSTPGC